MCLLLHSPVSLFSHQCIKNTQISQRSSQVRYC
jgi:hypothetical protein